MHYFLRLLATGGLCIYAAALARSQEPPRFVLNTGGPVSPVQALAFSPDSSRLYSAGSDKVVHSWQFLAGRRGALRADLVQTLRWEIARGHLGTIYALAASPVTRDLAIGGVSARDGAGDIVLYDTAAEVVRLALRSKDAASNRDGHAQAVVALAWSPTGQILASASIDGELRVWRAPNFQPEPPLRPALHVPGAQPGAGTDRPYPLAFVDDSVLAAISPADASGRTWQVVLYNLAGGAPVLLPQVHHFGITIMARQKGGPLWATGDMAGNIYLWNGTDPNQQPRVLRQDFHAGALEFGPPGVLFALGIPSDKGSVLQMWDIATAKVLDSTFTTRLERNVNGLAVSPDGRWLSTVGGDDGPVTSYQLQSAQGAPIEKPLSGPPPLRLRGRGERIGTVAFAAGPPGSLASDSVPLEYPEKFNAYGKTRRGFDLKNGVLLQPESVPETTWRSPEQAAGGWRIALGNRQKLQLYAGQQLAATITLNADRQGQATSYCWLAQGGQQPWGIAIGTDHQNGVYIYKTVSGGAECPLLRYFRDHTGWVTSISLSPDGGRYLASASADQTIKLWSLDGIGELAPSFARASAWGAVFQRDAQGVVLASRRPDGIAARRGLREGDRILRFQLSRNVIAGDQRLTAALGGAAKVNQLPPQVVLVDPAVIFAALEQLPLWETAVLTIARQPGQPILLKPAWEPLATLFVDQAGEWALSTPQGLYDASTAGDAMIGWQINGETPAQTPRFLKADQLRNELERPDVLRKLFAEDGGNLPQAVKLAGYPVPGGDLTFLVSSLSSNVPQIVRTLPGDASEMGNARPLIVQAQIQYPQPPSPNGYRIRAFVNGAAHEPVQAIKPGELPSTVSFEINQPERFNAVVFRVEENGVAAASPYVDKSVSFNATPSDGPKPRLHLLALAAAAYPKEQQRLQYSVLDAQAMLKALQTQSNEIYGLQEPQLLLDDQITKQSVGQAIDTLKQNILASAASDLLIVFVAGHGEVVDSQYYFVPPTVDLADRAAIKQRGIGWDLLDQISSLPCRKLFLLDTCNSGNVLSLTDAKKSIRGLVGNAAMVLTATGVNQEAHGFQADGQGLFTKVLLKALAGDADRGADGIIDALEASSYVQVTVPKLEARQTPMSFPLDLLGLDKTKLTRYPLVGSAVALQAK